jgi:hypothetical protein
MTKNEYVFVALLAAASTAVYIAGFLDGRAHRQDPIVEIEQHPFVQVQEKCSRCGEVWDRPRMACYLLDGKPEIRFCPKCVYQQADSFMKFCPVEE